tara:strand:+ start:4877 stop:6259 length:1383 start_codon:yes stop_codon:yes gene_type:complete
MVEYYGPESPWSGYEFSRNPLSLGTGTWGNRSKQDFNIYDAWVGVEPQGPGLVQITPEQNAINFANASQQVHQADVTKNAPGLTVNSLTNAGLDFLSQNLSLMPDALKDTLTTGIASLRGNPNPTYEELMQQERAALQAEVEPELTAADRVKQGIGLLANLAGIPPISTNPISLLNVPTTYHANQAVNRVVNPGPLFNKAGIGSMVLKSAVDKVDEARRRNQDFITGMAAQDIPGYQSYTVDGFKVGIDPYGQMTTAHPGLAMHGFSPDKAQHWDEVADIPSLDWGLDVEKTDPNSIDYDYDYEQDISDAIDQSLNEDYQDDPTGDSMFNRGGLASLPQGRLNLNLPFTSWTGGQPSNAPSSTGISALRANVPSFMQDVLAKQSIPKQRRSKKRERIEAVLSTTLQTPWGNRRFSPRFSTVEASVESPMFGGLGSAYVRRKPGSEWEGGVQGRIPLPLSR